MQACLPLCILYSTSLFYYAVTYLKWIFLLNAWLFTIKPCIYTKYSSFYLRQKIFNNFFCRFLLQLSSLSSALNQGSANLNIVETNAFKHLTHLSLKLLPGSDVEIKKYLATCLASMKVQDADGML